MGDVIGLRIPRLFVGQIIVVLEEQRQTWESTATYERGGCVPEDRLIKEASSVEDAEKMVEFYQTIISCVEGQLSEPIVDNRNSSET